MDVNVTIEWGSRSKTMRRKLQNKIAGDSFLLVSPGSGPVSLGWVSPLDVASWDTAMTIPAPVTRTGNQLAVSAVLTRPAVPDPADPALSLNYLHLRLDFELAVSAAGKTAVVLAFRQLFIVGTTGALQPVQCAIDDIVLRASPTGPLNVTPRGIQRRRFSGLHPLLSVTSSNISVNAEFVDLTALWWLIRNDKVGWYCHPKLGGRQTNLRVLGWTGGGGPMIWFAVIPDDAVMSLTAAASAIAGGSQPTDAAGSTVAAPADLVFFRPPPGVNAFVYTFDEQGLADARHDDTTLRILARYLLSPIPATDFGAIKSAGTVKEVDLLADQLQPLGGNSPAAPTPADPMDIASGYPFAFRPVGLEAAFNRAGGNRVLFLPLAAGDTATPYEGAVLSDLRTTLRNALTVLWSVAAVGRKETTIPNFNQRELWLAGHSAGNRSMWTCAQNNAADIGRLITFDATPWSDNLASGINSITLVVAARKKAKKGLDVFAIITPNLSQNKGKAGHPFQGLDDDTDNALRRTGAAVTILPDYPRRETYWKPVPISSPKSFVQYLLANWSDALLKASAANPSRWRFLFFHEMAVFGGDIIEPAAGASPNTPPTLRTFFEQALGLPNPRPPR
ncbi:MAG: hypothetical protein ACRERU_23020 [Methylococcales bacterium]